MPLLHWLARHGRVVLVSGLVIALVWPQLALAMRPWLPELIAVLLFMSALRIGHVEALGKLRDFPATLLRVLLYQLALPLTALGLFHALGWNGPLVFALCLTIAAAPILGGANLAIMTGNEAAPAMRLLIVGTALLPVTVLPVLWLLPQIGTVGAVIDASARLMLLIVLVTGVAFFCRHFFLPHPTPPQFTAIDGASALAMAVVVIGLMSAVGPALREEPVRLVQTLAAACTLNFGLQIVIWFIDRKNSRNRVAHAIAGGNRNVGLFITALPVSVIDPLLLFIGCYQVPMYLTPLVMGWLYRVRPAT